MMMRTTLFCCRAAASCVWAALFLGLLGSPARAQQTLHWDANGTGLGNGGTGIWNTAALVWSANDNGTTGPYTAWSNSAFDHAIFGGTAGTVTLGGPISAGSLTFNTHNYSIEGTGANSLTLSGATPTITANGSAVISAAIASTATLTKAGAGALTLSGSNSFTGGLTLDGGTLTLTGTNTLTGGLTVNGGRLTINGASNFTGTIDVDGGALEVLSNAALGDAANVVNLADGARLEAMGSLAGRTVNLTGPQGEIAEAGTGDAHFTGTGGLEIVTRANVTDDTNDFTGPASFFFSGSASFTSVRNLGLASSLGAAATAVDGLIRVTGVNAGLDALSYEGDGDVSNRDWDFTWQNSTSLQFANKGSGTLTLTGGMNINVPSGNRAMAFAADGADLVLLGVISNSGPGDGEVRFTGGAGGTITLGGANTYTFDSVIGVSQALTVRASVLADTGVASSFGTGTGGGISIGRGSVLDYIGAGSSSNRAWTLGIAGGSGGPSGSILNNGTGALTLSGGVTFLAQTNNHLTLGGTYAGVNTLSGVVSGGGNFISTGPTTWELTGANTRTGTITVGGGTLRAGHTSAFGTTLGVTINGGTLDLNGFNLATNSLAGTGGTLATGGANVALTLGTGETSSYAGSIAGVGGSMTKLGAGTLTLTGASTYTGATTIGGGTVVLDFSPDGGPASNIISDSSLLIMGGGTLTLRGAAGETNSQAFAGLNITAGNNTIDGSVFGTRLDVSLGAINRTGGLVNFVLPGTGSFTTTNLNGPLGGWATVNSSDYAKVDGGAIVAFTATDYVNKDDAATWGANEIISDALAPANSEFFGTVGSSVQIGGLQYTAADHSLVTVAGGSRLGVDGTIIVAPSVGAFNQTISGGEMTGTAGGGVLGVQQNGGGTFTIASQIVDNTGVVGFTKGGTGTVALTGANTYTGATTVRAGTLSISTVADAGTASAIGAASVDSSNLVLQAGTLRYTGATASSNRGFTFSTNGALTTNTIDVTLGGTNVTFGGVVTSPDSAGLMKTGLGTLTLSNAANNYIGATTVNQGTLSVGTLADGGIASGIGAASVASTNLVLQNDGELEYTGGSASTNRGFTVGTGGGAVDVFLGGTTLTVSGTVTGAGDLTKNGPGTLLLSGTNTYSGGTTVNAGILRAGSASAFGAGTMTVNAGATLDVNNQGLSVGALSGSGNVVNLGTSALRLNTGTQTFMGAIGGSGGLTRSGSGVQTFSGCNNTYTGITTINSSGTIATDCITNGGLASGIGASGAASANLVFASGSLQFTGTGVVTTDRGFTLQSGTNTLNVTNALTTLTFGGSVVGGGVLSKSGPGTLVLSGTNTYTGGTSVTAGTLRAGATNAFGTGGMALSNTAGVNLDLNNFNTTVSSLSGLGSAGGNISLGTATLTVSHGHSHSYGGAISGTGGFRKSGSAGGQALTSCGSSYAGSTVIESGVLAVTCLSNGGTNSSIGASGAAAGNLVLNGGTLRYDGAATNTDRLFTLGSSGGVLASSGTGAVEFTNTGPLSFTGAGDRTFTLDGTNQGNNEFAAQLTNNGANITSLTKAGEGTWILTNPGSTYTGVTTITGGGVLGVDKLSDGGLASSMGASSSAAANLVIGDESTLRYTGAGDSTNRLFSLAAGTTVLESSGAGAIAFTNTGAIGSQGTGARIFVLGGTNTGNNVMGASLVDGTGGATTLAKNDAGTWTLSGNSTYTGPTTVNAGALFVNGSLGNTAVNVSAGATLGGSGMIAGPLNVNNGGTLTPGASTGVAGTLATGALTLNAGSLLAYDLGMPNVIGPQNDLVNVTGNLTLDGTINVADVGTFATMPGSYRLFNYTGSLIDGGLAIGTTPGYAPGEAVLQTAVPGKVNLIVSRGMNVAWWDGSGAQDDSAINGGTQTWNNAAGNWTNVNGGFNQSWLNGMAIFESNPGLVTLGANVEARALQFSSTGYVIEGGGVSLQMNPLPSGGAPLIRIDPGITATINAPIIGTNGLEKADLGTLILGGTSTYSGTTTIAGGTLRIGGTIASSPVVVNTGATLSGTGSITGAVTVDAGGVIAPGASPGTLTVGMLNLLPGSVLEYELGTPFVVGGGVNDLIDVTGNLTLDGILNVTDVGGFNLGVYRLMNYGGALTDNTLDVGTMPGGFGYQVQSGSGQVNLIVSSTTPNSVLFWDGTDPLADGVVDGGTAVWNAANTNWTDASGNTNTLWGSQFAVFSGASGTVTVEGAQTFTGMQFLTDGYSIVAGAAGGLNTATAKGAMRVDAGITATLLAPIAGTGGLEKIDAGTLVLAGTNTYSGGTTVTAGILSVSSDDNLGVVTGRLTLNGGTLRTTSSFVSNRPITITSNNGAIDTLLATTATIAGADGAGALTKIGDGTLVLTGASTYTGGTTITAGTLQIGNGGSGASIAGDILNGSALVFNHADGVTFSGGLSGSGSLIKAGTGVLTLTNASPFTGTTAVTAGSLFVNGTLAAGPITVAAGGTIGGSGTIGQTTLAADAAISPGGAPNTIGELTTGPLALHGASLLQYDLGAPNIVDGTVNDLISVTGNLTLGGTLNVTDAGSFASTPGSYRLMNYTGTLVGAAGDVTIGTTPGYAPGDAAVQTAISGQVNLIMSQAGLPVQFWDGPGAIGDGAINGGTGMWDDTSGNWTSASGTINQAWLGGMGIFGGLSAGTVSLGGNLSARALQFTRDGYVVTGGAGSASLTLLGMPSGSDSIVRVDSGVTATIAANLTGASGLNKLDPGTLVLTGTNTYAGLTTVAAGTLRVDGSLTGGATVGAGAVLEGAGSIGGHVTVNPAGTIAPGTGVGTLTVGSLTLLPGSLLNYELDAPGVIGGGVNDLIDVAGDLTLDGLLSVTTLPGFGLGTYRLMNYGGTLVDNGLDIDLSLLPTGPIYEIQTSVAGQISLIADNTPEPIQYWNGSHVLADGIVHGGTSVWTAGRTNWTNVSGSTAKTWGGQLAVFAGAAGTVTVAGEIAFTGLQFETSGYTLTAGAGGALNTGTANTVIKVASGGDATIGVPITGTGGITLQGGGVLTFTGPNTYSGGTTIGDGTLSISSDQNLGAAASGVILDGGTLRTTANLLSNRGVTLAAGGTVETLGGSVFSLQGHITGAGSLTKAGEGLLILAGLNSYGGGTTIGAGTLSISADENLGASSGGVTIDGGTLQTTADLTSGRHVTLERTGGTIETVGGTFLLEGEIDGSGALTKAGGGLLVLTGANTYGGRTMVEAGTLQIGNCGTSGSIVGDVTNNGLLVFSRSDTNTFNGTISGSGAVMKNCAGTQILRGANTYTGGTLITAGTLIGDTTSLQGEIVSNAALVFDQNTDGTFRGTLFGTGTLDKTGSGTVLLTGDHGLHGLTTIHSGRLGLDGTLLGAVHVMQGAALDANGAIGGALDVDGAVTVRANADGAFGVLGVLGDVAFTPGSRYGVTIGPDGTNSALVTSGAATVDGALVDVAARPGEFGRVTQYAILQADGGLDGTATATAAAHFDPVLSDNGRTLFLTLLRTDLPLQPLAGTASGWGVGGAIDRIKAGATGDLRAVTRELTALDDTTLGLALDSIAGEMHASATQLAAIDGESVMDVIRSEVGLRGWSRRSTDVGVTSSATSPWGPRGRRAWFRFRGERGSFEPASSVEGRRGAHGGELSLDGFALGMDWAVSRNWLVGVGGSYASGDLVLDELAERSRFSAPRGLVYAAYARSHWAVQSGVSLAHLGYERTRALSFVAVGPAGALFEGVNRQATSEPSGLGAEVWSEARIDLPVGAWTLQPAVGVRAARFGLGAFEEAGAGALSLRADAQANHTVQTDLGARFSRVLGRFRPYVGGTYRRQLSDGRTRARLQLGASEVGLFEVDGLFLAQDVAVGQAGVYLMRNKFSFLAGYEARRARQQTRQTLQLGIGF